MAGYILDTSVLSVYLAPTHQRHAQIFSKITLLEQTQTLYLSAIVLAELQYGLQMAQAFQPSRLPALTAMLNQARNRGPMLPITHHTGEAYAKLKTRLALKYLSQAMRQKRRRPRWIQDWVDQATGKRLQVDENDLWICAQAKERALTVVTADKGMQRIADADPDVVLWLL